MRPSTKTVLLRIVSASFRQRADDELSRINAADRRASTRLAAMALLVAGSGLFLGRVPAASAQSVGVPATIHQFSNARPVDGLILGSDGNFYGTTTGSGDNGFGAFFRITLDGTVTTLHSFNNTDGAAPSGLTQGSDGNFYGTTSYGGASGTGTVFRVTTAGVLTSLHSFSSTVNGDSISPTGLVEGKDGNFYGTTIRGGANGVGIIYRITPAGELATLHSFSLSTGDAGVYDTVTPSRLAVGNDGNLYGTLETGGDRDFYGTIYRITPGGSFTTLHNFDYDDGYVPSALVLGRDGNFYGTTAFGGGQQSGTVYRITPAGALTTLASFDRNFDSQNVTSALIESSDGNFYGTTFGGGSNDAGTAFRVTPAGAITILKSFSLGYTGYAEPSALALGSDGNFYGTTSYGTVYRLTSGGVYASIHTFSRTTNDGSVFPSSLAPDGEGNFYGTTNRGGHNQGGTIYRVDSAGEFTTLHRFDFDGFFDEPSSSNPLAQGSDGNFYGITNPNGDRDVDDDDTVFYQITPGGKFTALHQFDGATEGNDGFGLVPDGNGNFLGATGSEGPSNSGTLYRITATGEVTILVSNFDRSDSLQELPSSGLVKGADGNFYGTTRGVYSQNDSGSIYRLTPAGVYSVLYAFYPGDGENPAGLVLGSDGNLYGTTSGNQDHNHQIIYRITTAGALTVLHRFTAADGIDPSLLTPGSDGNFYGTTRTAGADVAATIFRVTAGGKFFTLHRFGSAVEPGALLQGSDGSFYGTTNYGEGVDYQGSVYRVNLLGPAITSGTGAEAIIGNAFTYQITATNTPASYQATGLPAGLSVDTATGTITGTPVETGTFSVPLQAIGDGGTARATLVVQVSLPRPVVTSNLSPVIRAGVPFSYQITATNNPTSFHTLGLPGGLGLSTTTGLISGTPTRAGTYNVAVSAANRTGTGTATLTLVVGAAALTVTSDLNPPIQAGVAFDYQITSTGAPTSFHTRGLPAGLGLSTTTGKITGTPTTAGTFQVAVSVAGAGGTGAATLTLRVKAPVLEITSDLNPPSRQGIAFGYQITATGQPTSFSTLGLPAGLGLNKTTGRISGTPTRAGTYRVAVSASNGAGAGAATLNLVVKEPLE